MVPTLKELMGQLWVIIVVVDKVTLEDSPRY